MRVQLTVGDFLERAANVYGDRIAVVDEPGRPGDLGEITYACTFEKFFPVVTPYQTKAGQQLIVAVMAAPVVPKK